MQAQAAPQIVKGAVRKGNVSDARRASRDFVAGPETRVDVDRLKAIRQPRDPHAAVFLHRLIVPLASLVSVFLTPASALAAGEPGGYEYFHTYAEVKSEVDAAVAAHPSIARRGP